jgi:hypothetical protein
MPTIADIKQQYPDLAGLDDEGVVTALHGAFYADMPREQVAAALGVKPAPEPVKPRTLGGVVKDVGISALKGAIGVPESAVGLADMVSGGQAGKFLENEGGAVGFRPKQAKDFLDEQYSPQQKEAFRRVQAADGLGDTIKEVVTNPSVIGHSIVESLPSMGAGGVLARAGLALAPKLGAIGASNKLGCPRSTPCRPRALPCWAARSRKSWALPTSTPCWRAPRSTRHCARAWCAARSKAPFPRAFSKSCRSPLATK